MITITKTISSCLSNRIVSCIYLWSHVRLSAESYLKRQLNTYIIRIHSSRSATPVDILDYCQQQKLYNKLATFSQDLLSARRLKHTWKESFPSWVVDITAPQLHEQDTRDARVPQTKARCWEIQDLCTEYWPVVLHRLYCVVIWHCLWAC